MAEGDIGAVIDTLVFDSSACYEPDLIHIDGDIYAIAYRGPDDDGWIKTVSIDDAGNIGAAAIDSVEFDGADGARPSVIHVDDDVYAFAYRGPGSDGWIKTYTISAAGDISAAAVDSFEFETGQCVAPRIIHVYDTVYAIVFERALTNGRIITLSIEGNGDIGAANIDSLDYASAPALEPMLIHIYATMFAIAYRGTDSDGYIKTLSIANDGNIAAGVTDTQEFAPTDGNEPEGIHVADDVHAFAFSDDFGRGRLSTWTISDGGDIGAAEIDNLIFDASGGYHSSIIKVSGIYFAIAYNGPGSDGWLKTIGVDDSGNIDAAAKDSFEFDAVSCHEPDILHITGDIYAIAYRATGNVGNLKTVNIKTVLPAAAKHLPFMGVG